MPGERVFVGLGANLGDARATLEAALLAIAALPRTQQLARSSIYRTAPVETSGPAFLNAVAELSTALEPDELLLGLQAIERAHGRERPYRNAPRTLDLDLLAYGQRVLQTPDLTLPHPRAHLRAFVLQPLAELATGWHLAGRGEVATLAAAITGQAIEKLSR